MEIRKYRPGEEQALFDIFRSSILQNAKDYYTEEQLKAWGSAAYGEERWINRMKGINPFVIIDDNVILGYADLQDSGYIDHFFIKGGQNGKGVGRKLMEHIIAEAKVRQMKELTADVSLAAQDFFGRFGFVIEKRKMAEMRGMILENALMRKVM